MATMWTEVGWKDQRGGAEEKIMMKHKDSRELQLWRGGGVGAGQEKRHAG